jgi:hypothetical protein
MKIQVDLAQIFTDEDGVPTESMEEAIRRQIIDKLTGDMRKRLTQQVDAALAAVMQAEIAKVIEGKMPTIVEDIMEATYTPVTTFGQRGEPTNFRNEIIKAITQNLKYEPRNFSSDESAFTKAVKSIVEKKTSEIQKAITEQVDVKFKEDAIKFAVQKLSERLGLNK